MMLFQLKTKFVFQDQQLNNKVLRYNFFNYLDFKLLRSTPKRMEGIESSETSALKAQTPGDYPKNHDKTFFKHITKTLKN